MIDAVKSLLEWLAIPLALDAIYLHFWELRKLKEERKNLQLEKAELSEDKRALEAEIVRIKDTRGTEALDLTYKTICSLNPLGLCPICKELLLLVLSTKASIAIKQLNALSKCLNTSKDSLPQRQLGLVRVVLEEACRLTPWPSWQRDETDNLPALINRILAVYKDLLPHLGERETQSAIEFCTNNCQLGLGDLRKGSAIHLLPVLLKHCPESERLINTYTMLFELGLKDKREMSEEENEILIGLFAELRKISRIVSSSVCVIWTTAFRALSTISNDSYRDGDQASVLYNWWRATEDRLHHLRLDVVNKNDKPVAKKEFEDLSRLIAEYMGADYAPSRAQSYYHFAQAAAAIRQALDSSARGFRPPNRSVPKPPIPVEICLAEGAPVFSQLINFSVENGQWTPGGYALSHEDPLWPVLDTWRSARILVRTPQRDPAVFEQAQMKGPEVYATTSGRGYGFRIKFGPPLSGWESLREYAEQWPQR